METLSFAEILACFPIVDWVYESEGRLHICIRPEYKDERMQIMSGAHSHAMGVITKLAEKCNYSYRRVEVHHDGTETWSWSLMG